MTRACATTLDAVAPLRSGVGDGCAIRLGPYDVVVRGAHPQALADFAHLYSTQRIGALQQTERIELEITRRSLGLGRSRYAIQCGDETIFSDLRSREVLPYLEWAVNYRFIATCRRYLLLHAATVVWRGHGIVLVGSSGSGKSTLAAALAARGGQYLCDEFAVIDPGELSIHPFPRALCVKSGSFAIMRAVGLPMWRRRCHVKAFKGRVGYVRPADLNAATEPHAVDTIILPRFTGATAPAMHEIPLSQAAFALAANALNAPEHPRSTADAMAQLAAQSVCRVLEVGDIHATADLLERLIIQRSYAQAG